MAITCTAPPGHYRLALATDDARFGGPGTADHPARLEIARDAPAVVELPAHTARIYLSHPRSPGGEP